jgi:hypothetical protein
VVSGGKPSCAFGFARAQKRIAHRLAKTIRRWMPVATMTVDAS